MFVPRSARRIRFVRTAFVVVGLLPCAALVAWAAHRHSAAHRDAIRSSWERAIGLPITVASVEHPLPGVVRARGCVLQAADGSAVLDLGTVVVESTPTEVRLGIGSLACDPAGAAVLAGLATEWLERGARFTRDVVIDVAACDCHVPEAVAHGVRRALGPVRIECVVQSGARAMRIVRRAAADDEVRIVRSPGDGEAVAGGGRLDVEASWAEPLPFPILAAVVARTPWSGASSGHTALVRGRLAATRTAGRWSGTAQGRVAGLDLAACTAALPAKASGVMDVDVRSIEWRDGRLDSAEFACDAAAGRVDRRLLEALVTTADCRAGAGYGAAVAEPQPAFEALGCVVRISGRGIELAGSGRLDGALVVANGRPVLNPPVGRLQAERVAWLMAPPGAVSVPASAVGAWLMSVFPPAGGAVDRASRAGDGPRTGDF